MLASFSPAKILENSSSQILAHPTSHFGGKEAQEKYEFQLMSKHGLEFRMGEAQAELPSPMGSSSKNWDREVLLTDGENEATITRTPNKFQPIASTLHQAGSL
jgi:hypothetical protein